MADPPATFIHASAAAPRVRTPKHTCFSPAYRSRMISLQAAPAQRLQCTDAGHMEPALAAFADYHLTETD